MSCNSCNRNTSQNSGSMGARNNQMYHGNQSMRNGQMNRNMGMNRGMNGMHTGHMTTGGYSKDKNDCGCKEEKSDDYRHMNYEYFADSCNQATAPVDSMMLAMAYVPWQQWGETFDYEKSLQCGTIFEELVKPWMGRSCE